MLVLRSLPPADWDRRTLAKDWAVRDVVAHLVDGDLRRLSFHRDRHPVPDPEKPIDGYEELVGFINDLNRRWIQVAKRFSPAVLMGLLDRSGREVADFVESLDPFAPGLFSVAWAGEDVSLNWMDIGREYTERWHHQQQIREAVGASLLLADRWMRPLLELSVRAFPKSFASVTAEPGAEIQVAITGSGGGTWTLVLEDDGWAIYEGSGPEPDAIIRVAADKAWRIFYNALEAEEGIDFEISGNRELTRAFASTRAVMV